ncbi:MAG: Druantia anti-phage system protein DruA [Sedimentisphaerales bacterium]
MQNVTVIQGRKIKPTDIQLIQQLLAENPSWGRSRLSLELCQQWNWRRPDQSPKDMACRSLLLKLGRAGQIVLPPRKGGSPNALRNRSIPSIPHSTEEIDGNLKALVPLQVMPLSPRSDGYSLFQCLLSRYHYLGHKNTVGQNMRYLIRDRAARPLACALFGSAAWKTAPRDAFIGWDPSTREKNLGLLTNNSRFLILPWVKVPHLASHILSRISRRVCSDWMAKYGHPIYLLETFVDRSRFRGTCYKAANWTLIGQTQGRSRNDRDRTTRVSAKDIYVYPLIKKFRRELCDADA